MFIEISEFLRCPEPHADSVCVVVPHEMAGRMIVRGIVGCPVCRREYPIANGTVRFGETAETAETAKTPGAPDADVIGAVLGLTSPGGLVVLVGSAARLAAALAARLDGVHFIGINADSGVAMSPALTLLRHPQRIPLRQSVARGVVLGAEVAAEPWVGEGARVLLNGQRLVAVADAISAPGLTRMAAERGLWVGRKTQSAISRQPSDDP